MKTITRSITVAAKHLYLIPLVLSMYSCNHTTKQTIAITDMSSSDSTVDLSHMIQLADTLYDSKKISLWTSDSLSNKFESLYLKYENDKTNSAASLDYQIVMDMGMMSHPGPSYPLVNLGNGVYRADVVFNMANIKDMGKGWLFKTIVKEEDKTDTLIFSLLVHQDSFTRTLLTKTKRNDQLFVSCLLPQEVKVGKQTIAFVLSKKDKEILSNVDDYTVAIEPFMPAMKHGSSENEHAKSIGNGKYSGMIHFSMPGEWIVKVKLMKDKEALSEDTLIYTVKVK
ncbi:FixH family protein [Sphingobacterium faecium]|uniref:FixH family protein n=1 Tax=Sphingobacterium faecium TaxID=34087 RepID=UPI002469C2EE|nr:FixH family protein [Sphingobacterium faecium]MDH5825871.1 FixH family protein [Sphingobacterium faecium]